MQGARDRSPMRRRRVLLPELDRPLPRLRSRRRDRLRDLCYRDEKLERLPDILGLQAGSLGDPSIFRLEMDVFTASAQPWDHMYREVQKLRKVRLSDGCSSSNVRALRYGSLKEYRGRCRFWPLWGLRAPSQSLESVQFFLLPMISAARLRSFLAPPSRPTYAVFEVRAR